MAIPSSTTCTPDLRVDFILANPPFNMKAWGGEQLGDDVRWQYGQPPKNNANFAWVQHMIHHLAPNGRAGFILANGSMSTNTGGEDEIRKAIIEADLVDCMVVLPGQLFYTTKSRSACGFSIATNRAAQALDEIPLNATAAARRSPSMPAIWAS